MGILEFLSFTAIILTSNKRAVRAWYIPSVVCSTLFHVSNRTRNTISIFNLAFNTWHDFRTCIETYPTYYISISYYWKLLDPCSYSLLHITAGLNHTYAPKECGCPSVLRGSGKHFGLLQFANICFEQSCSSGRKDLTDPQWANDLWLKPHQTAVQVSQHFTTDWKLYSILLYVISPTSINE